MGCEQAPHSLLLSRQASASLASEFTHSLSWHPTRKFKPHTRAISALAIVPSSQITLISKSDKTSSRERGFSTSITLELHLVQPHCARMRLN